MLVMAMKAEEVPILWTGGIVDLVFDHCRLRDFPSCPGPGGGRVARGSPMSTRPSSRVAGSLGAVFVVRSKHNLNARHLVSEMRDGVGLT